MDDTIYGKHIFSICKLGRSLILSTWLFQMPHNCFCRIYWGFDKCTYQGCDLSGCENSLKWLAGLGSPPISGGLQTLCITRNTKPKVYTQCGLFLYSLLWLLYNLSSQFTGSRRFWENPDIRKNPEKSYAWHVQKHPKVF